MFTTTTTKKDDLKSSTIDFNITYISDTDGQLITRKRHSNKNRVQFFLNKRFPFLLYKWLF